MPLCRKKKIPAECNYEIYDKELLAIVNAFETWTAELGSVEASTLVLTDHKNLEYFTTTKRLNRRQVRWNELLADFDFKIVFRPGKQGAKPDALTRIGADRPQDDNDSRNVHQNQVLIKPTHILRPVEDAAAEADPIEPNQWATACRQDDLCQQVRQALEDPEKTVPAIEGVQLASCTLTEHSFKFRTCKYVSDPLWLDLLSRLHDTPAAGHRGAASLFEHLSRRFWWPNCHKDSTRYARGCEACQRNNPNTRRPYGQLQPLEPPQSAFRHLTLDYIGPLPECKVRGYTYRYILQVIDRLTKRAWITPTETTTARETALALRDNVFRFCGLPDSLTSDQGRCFIDATWKDICKELKINHKLSTSYHPQTDGQTERSNKSLEVYLRHFVNFRQDDWAQQLPIAEYCFNDQANASTKTTPFFASFGHHPRLDFRPESERTAPRPEFTETIQAIQENCRASITLAQAYQESYANEKRLPTPRFQTGDSVFLSLKNIATARPTVKLNNLRAGPYKITTMKTPLVAKLDLPATLSRLDNNFHVSLLRPAYEGFPSQQQDRPPPVELGDDSGDFYELEEILDTRIRHRKRGYLIRWTGYADATWEKEENLGEAGEALEDFKKKYPDRV